MAQFLPFCKDIKRGGLNMLMVGRQQIIEPLSASIREANSIDNTIFKLKVHKCESVQQVLSSSRTFPHVDYIIFCIQSNNVKFIKEIEKDIISMSKMFLLNRICLVLGLCGGICGSDLTSIMDLRQKYDIHVLNCTISDEDNRLELSKRILRLVSFVCGLQTGYPHIEYHGNFVEKPKEQLSDTSASDFSTEEQ